MFDDISQILLVHAIAGSSALVSFWFTASFRKGSRQHVRSGRVYLISMCLVLLTTIPIIIHYYLKGEVQRMITVLYLFFVTLSGMVMVFFSIRRRMNVENYRSPLFKALGFFMIAFGLVIFWLAMQPPPLAKKILLFSFSSLGLVIGSGMLKLAFAKLIDKKWWLAQHLNGVMIAFAATHASFLGLGLRKLVPAFSGDWMHTTTQAGVILMAYLLRIYLGKILLTKTTVAQLA